MDKLIVGCGYLGRRVARRWVDEGFSVAAATRRPEAADSARARSPGDIATIDNRLSGF